MTPKYLLICKAPEDFVPFAVNLLLGFSILLNNNTTRWYPQGIQILVSTYDLPDSGPGGGGYSGVKTEKILKVPGGGALWSEIPERGPLENLDTNFTV